MMMQAGNAVAAWIYLWMTFQLSFYESIDLLPRVSASSSSRSSGITCSSSSIEEQQRSDTQHFYHLS